jgi:isocitrate/isopropylmalate dehydrogenase
MGANKANPAAMILSATMLLRHLGLESQANVIASAVYDVIKEGKIRTADMGGEWFLFRSLQLYLVRWYKSIWLKSTGNTSTTDFTKAIMQKTMA